MFILKGHLLRLGDCPGCIYPTRTAPPPPQIPVAPSPRSSMAPRATSPRTCPQKGTLLHRTWSQKTGRKRDVSTRGEERFYLEENGVGVVGVFLKKNVFLFVSSIQMVFVKFPDVFLLYMLVNFSTGSSGKLSRIFAFFCSICPGCGCCGFIWKMWVMLGKYPKNWYHHGVYTYRVYAGIVKTNC